MQKILLDTNFLLVPGQFNVDIFAEIARLMHEKYQLFVLDKSIGELNKLIGSKGQRMKDKRAAKLALQLIEAKEVSVLGSGKDMQVDDLIVELDGYIVATQDMELKRRLKAKKTRLITLRSKKHIIFS